MEQVFFSQCRSYFNFRFSTEQICTQSIFLVHTLATLHILVQSFLKFCLRIKNSWIFLSQHFLLVLCLVTVFTYYISPSFHSLFFCCCLFFRFDFIFLAVSWTHIWLSKNQRISCVKIMFGICNEPTYKFSSGRSWIFTKITSRGLFFSLSGSSFFR